MKIRQTGAGCNPLRDAPIILRDTLPREMQIAIRDRPALKQLIDGMERRLSHRQRHEIARMGRRAKAARQKWLRRLTSEAAAEARRQGAGE